MTIDDPTLLVLTLSTAAALAAALGAVPHFGRRRLPTTWIGWANAMAAGGMLGAAFALAAADTQETAVRTALGAVLGIAFIYWTHAVGGTEDLDLNRVDGAEPVYAYQVLVTGTLHGACEGVAIAAAMATDLGLGVFLAAVIALHNVPEGTILTAVLRGHGVTLRGAAGLAVAVNAGQVVSAVAAFAVMSAAPAVLPWLLGFAVGALIELTLSELLPESYREAGPTSIAVVTVGALGVVVLFEGLLG